MGIRHGMGELHTYAVVRSRFLASSRVHAVFALAHLYFMVVRAHRTHTRSLKHRRRPVLLHLLRLRLLPLIQHQRRTFWGIIKHSALPSNNNHIICSLCSAAGSRLPFGQMAMSGQTRPGQATCSSRWPRLYGVLNCLQQCSRYSVSTKHRLSREAVLFRTGRFEILWAELLAGFCCCLLFIFELFLSICVICRRRPQIKWFIMKCIGLMCIRVFITFEVIVGHVAAAAFRLSDKVSSEHFFFFVLLSTILIVSMHFRS